MIRLYPFWREYDGVLLIGSMLKTSLFDLIAYVPIILLLGVYFLSLAEPIAPDAVLHIERNNINLIYTIEGH